MTCRNRISNLEFTLQHILWFPLLTLFYSSVLFHAIPSFSFRQSKILLWCLSAVCIALGCLVTKKRHRNLPNLIVSFLIPYELYTCMTYGKYCPALLDISCRIALFLCSLFCIWMLFVPVSPSARIQTVMLSRAKHGFIVCRAIFALCLSSILVWNLATQINGGIPVNMSIPASKEQAWSDQDAIQSHINTLTLLRPEEWAQLSRSEKMDVLQTVVNLECGYLGLPYELSLKTDILDNHTNGTYNHTAHQITIDTAHLTNSPPEKVLNTVFHEGYHAYEHTLVELYIDSDAQHRKLRIFRRVNTYAEEFMSYEDGSSDLRKYAAQLVEADARDYAKAAVQDYYTRLEEYG